MITGVHDIPPEFLQIKKDDKFFSRLLSKESSKGNESSFRVLYYGSGAAGSIPFTWESAPGTPKHALFSDNPVPPLTPPPSYQLMSHCRMKTMRSNSKPSFLGSIFSRKSRKRFGNDKLESLSSSSLTLSYCSSSSHSLPSTPTNKHSGQKGNGMARSRSAVQFGFGVDDRDEHEQIATSPTSTLCFGISHPMRNVMKRVFLSIARRGTP